jgi:hypothetical protein
MLLSRRICVHPFGASIRLLDESRAVTPASMTSPACAPVGRVMVSEEDFPAELDE